MPTLNQKTKKQLAFIFLVYVIVRIVLNLPAFTKPRDLADTITYLRISKESLNDINFWADERPFVFPLLLKILNQNFSAVVIFQIVFSIFAWVLLALAVSIFFRDLYLPFMLILALSLVRHLAGWDYSIMTESLSISLLVLLLACGIWLVYEWRIYKIVVLVCISLFFAFIRDTNSYLLLIFAGMLMLAVFFRWVKPSALILGLSFVFIFLINNYFADLGKRWVFPMNNNIGRRILVSYAAIDYFKSCGMPVTPQLLLLANSYAHGPGRSFYTDPALEGYREWLDHSGKSCYIKWLLHRPNESFAELFDHFEELVRFDDLDNFLAHKYDPVIPKLVDGFIYPVKFIVPLWFVLTFAALIAIGYRAWRKNPLWGIYILLCLSILPHLFIVWHGDAMESQRHALAVGLQFSLCFSMMIIFLYDWLISLWKPNNACD